MRRKHMSKSKKFKYNDGVAEVEVYYKGIKATGKARLHPDDVDFGNELTGLSIAEFRALQKVHYKQAVALRADAKRLEAELLEQRRRIAEQERIIEEYKKIEKDYIEGKEKFYQGMRDLRDPKKQESRKMKMEALKNLMAPLEECEETE